MRYLKKATKMAFDEVPATCPVIADILSLLQEKYDISEDDIDLSRKLIARLATERLRAALIDSNRLFLVERSRNK